MHFELFFKDIHNLDILPKYDLGFVNEKAKEAVLSSYRYYNKNMFQNLSEEKFSALQNPSKIKDLIIQKSHKGNSVVIIDRLDYIKKMNEILSDQKKLKSKFER